MTKLRHRTSLDLANSFASQIEVLSNLLERAGFTAVETETEFENLTLTLVERRKQSTDLVGKKCCGGNLEWRIGRPILDHVAKFGIAVFSKRLRQRQGLSSESKRLGHLVFRQFHLSGELREGCGTAELEL